MLDINNFDWGWLNEHQYFPDGSIVYHSIGDSLISLSVYIKDSLIREIFIDKVYEKFFSVEYGDLVVDIGASLGPFTYSILDKYPLHVYCIEPSFREFRILNSNVRGYPVTTINKAISDSDTGSVDTYIFGMENSIDDLSKFEVIKFSSFISRYNIGIIDFMKLDCEGGEYYIFTEENRSYIMDNIKKIVGEWHLSTVELKDKFRWFRDNFLVNFRNYLVYSIDGVDIKWDLFNDHFIEYYNEVTIYIDNRD